MTTIALPPDIADMLGEVYTAEGVRIWLNSRNRMLDMARPRDLLKTQDGTAMVREVAQFISSGF